MNWDKDKKGYISILDVMNMC